MFKKYTVMALGALVLSGQASGMGSWKRLCVPAVAAVVTAKTLYQSDNGQAKDYVGRFKAWAGWASYGIESSVSKAKIDQMPTPVKFAAAAGVSGLQVGLDYNPRITVVVEKDDAVTASPRGRKTVYVHGFGANKEAAAGVKRYFGTERLPGDVVTFDFPDAAYSLMDTSKSSLGQWNDMKALLFVLNKLNLDGEREIGINGHSRGGATVVNAVAALADQTGKYDARLAEIGIGAQERQAILRKLQNGHIVLECPLINVRSVVKHQIKEVSKISWWTRIFGSSASSSAVSADYAAPLVLKKYSPWAEQALKSAELWNGLNIPTIVHFQEQDEVLGNEKNAEFLRKLQASNGPRTFSHIGNDGGHNSSFKSFEEARNDFLRKYGAAYKLPSAGRK